MRWFLSSLVVFLMLWRGPGLDAEELPPGDTSPILQISAEGPTSYVTGLAWSSDGSTLYATSWDKRIHAWTKTEEGFVPEGELTKRVPIGGGLHGALSTVDVSEDGTWIAAAGNGFSRNDMGTRREGWVIPESNHLTEAEQTDRGLIYVFHTKERRVKLLRGHRDVVKSVRFVRGTARNTWQLASLGEERVGAQGQFGSVVRLWDVERETELAKLESGPSGPLPVSLGMNPCLEAWSSAGVATIGLALPQAPSLWLWTPRPPGGEPSLISRTSGNYANFLAIAKAGDKLLVGGNQHLSLLSWRQPAVAGRLELEKGRMITHLGLSPDHDGRAAVLETRRLSKGLNGSQTAEFETRLRIVQWSGTPLKLQFAGPADGTVVYQGGLRTLSLAAGSDRVAVGGIGRSAEEIRVYRWQDLIRPGGGSPASELLRSAGQANQGVAFVRSAEDDAQWGLALSSQAKNEDLGAWLAESGTRVFDAARRSLTAGTGWRPELVDLAGWRVTPLPEQGRLQRFRVQSAVGEPVEIDVEPVDEEFRGHRVTAYSLCPPVKTRNTPLLVVATLRYGEPFLRAFRADDGQEVLWFTGHTGQIRDLAVSGDGRVVASVADDHTVCLWPLVRVDEEVVDRGGAGELAVEIADDRLKIRKPGTSGLEPGDILLREMDQPAARPLTTVRELHQAFRRRRVGEHLDLECSRNGKTFRNEVKVVQAVRERKPICTLFLADRNDHSTAWALWHPSGRFDASGPEAERLLGWHFNTGEKGSPTRFVSIDQYRADFYRRHLLPTILQSEGLELPDEEEAPLPEMSLILESLDDSLGGTRLDPDPNGVYRLQSAAARLVLAPSREIPPERIAALRWEWGGELRGDFSTDDAGRWTATIEGIPLDRRLAGVQVELLTAETVPQRRVLQLTAMGIPAAPSIRVEGVPAGGATAEDRLPLKVRVNSNSRVEVTVWRTENDKERLIQREKLDGSGAALESELELAPGDNQYLIRAVHLDANDYTQRDETSTVYQQVVRTVEDGLTIEWERFSAPSADPNQESLLPKEGTPLVTGSPKLRIQGRIRSDMVLDEARLTYAGRQSEIAGFTKGQVKSAVIDETVDLEPGENSWKVTAVSGGKTLSRFVRIDYRPELPRLAQVRFRREAVAGQVWPEGADLPSDSLFEGWHEPFLDVQADIQPAQGVRQLSPETYTVSLIVNDKAHPIPAKDIDRTDSALHRVSTKVPLSAGRNRISVMILNQWNSEPVAVAREFWLRRPPRLIACDVPEETADPVIDVTGEIESVPELTSVKAYLGERLISPDSLRYQKNRDNPFRWTFTIKDLALTSQENRLSIRAANEESETLEPYRKTVVRRNPPGRSTVEISVLNRVGQTTTARFLALDLGFKSLNGPILSIGIFDRAGREIGHADEILKSSADPSEIRWRPQLALEDGPNNRFEIRASNLADSEPVREVIEITRVPPAASLAILQIDGRQPMLTGRGWTLSGVVAQSPVQIEGQLITSREKGIPKSVWLKATVNGILRQSVQVNPYADGRFDLSLVLNKPQDNQIELQVLDMELPLEERTLRLDCARPDQDQELFLLMIGPQAGSDEDLKRAAFQSLHIKPVDGKAYAAETAGFQKVHAPIILSGPKINRRKVTSALGQLEKLIETKSAKNPVVMIYYRGRDQVKENGSLLLALPDNWDRLDDPDELTADRNAVHQLTDWFIKDHIGRWKVGNLLIVDVDRITPVVRRPQRAWEAPAELAVFRRVYAVNGKPTDNPLLADLEPVLPKVATLDGVKQHVDRLFFERQHQASPLDHSVRLPPSMKNLSIGSLVNSP